MPSTQLYVIRSNNIQRITTKNIYKEIMGALKYTVIKTEEQYYEYCNLLEEIEFSDEADEREDEIELLTLLIRTWDDEHRLAPESDPVELIKSLMKEHELSQNDLATIAGVGKSYISEILNYKKRLSKKVIRNLGDNFKIQQEALNKHYRLEGEGKFEDDNPMTSKVFDIQTGQKIDYIENTEGIEVENDHTYSIAK